MRRMLKIYGSELNANWHATPEFSVTLGGTYLHARYADFTTASLDVPIYVNGLPTGNTNIKADASGNTMIGGPTITANLTPRYIKTTSVGTFDFSSTFYYSTRVFYDVGDRIVQPGYVNLNATMMWQPVGSKWQFGLWGKEPYKQVDDCCHHHRFDRRLGPVFGPTYVRSQG